MGKRRFNPIIIGDQCIIHDLKHPSDKSYPIDITIDACQAFGTGTHNTTRMIVEELLKMTLQDKTLCWIVDVELVFYRLPQQKCGCSSCIWDMIFDEMGVLANTIHKCPKTETVWEKCFQR